MQNQEKSSLRMLQSAIIVVKCMKVAMVLDRCWPGLLALLC